MGFCFFLYFKFFNDFWVFCVIINLSDRICDLLSIEIIIFYLKWCRFRMMR